VNLVVQPLAKGVFLVGVNAYRHGERSEKSSKPAETGGQGRIQQFLCAMDCGR
jgi:hypothetical protein